MESNPFTALCRYYDELANHGEVTDTPMTYEGPRLKSFHRIEINSSCIRLAAAGFYATHDEDETKCYSCGVTHRDWRAHDNPFLTHRALSDNCIHMANIDADFDANEQRNMRLESPESLQPTQGQGAASRCEPSWGGNDTNNRLTSLHIDGAVHPHYSEFGERLKSFVTWPVGHCKKPEDLVKAGFFYAGYADCVRCYVCGVGLRTWEADDDPWTEHVRWRSSCDYVKTTKGQDFVLQRLVAIGRENRNVESISETRNVPPPGMDVMDTGECRMALEMGFDEQQVRQTAERITSNLETLRLESFIESMMADDKGTTSGTSRSTETTADTCAPQSADIPVKSDYSTYSDLGSDEEALGLEIHSPDENHHSYLPRNDSSGGHTGDKQQTFKHVKLPPDKTKSESSSVESGSLPSYSQTTEEENRELKESSLCKICLDDQANIVFLPCGHLVTCATCSPGLDRCPVCRKHIRGTVRVHLANKDSVKKDS